ncbi:toxin-antitoxin system YwqK family antitoxin [Labilibaculum euxinus]|uniref:Toxin-antitoxin system YwqK family antitoxin n=1 Tax=Labilibaculum euxinus TaxID=2686357 RepID=A0A7M4D186_9BACT|nr:hypothetical protein [Labilibaculum euxinus]MUP36415.1 hypothetical protein [Labilibaculum euxinus]MVB05620.1 hypothetical protein [Labilibaculum euxinus]
MKQILILLLTLSYLTSNSQGLEFFKILGNDSIMLYFNNAEIISSIQNSTSYRITKIDTTFFTLKGRTIDYFRNGKIKYQCNYSNGYLNGNVYSYFKNGNPKYIGNFKKSKRDSVWKYYYPNGGIEKLIVYNQNIPYFKEFYSKKGSPEFLNGNGKFKGKILINEQPVIYKISGDIVNGIQEGKWSFKNSTGATWTLRFENGIPLEETNYNSTIAGYEPLENVKLFKFVSNTINYVQRIAFSQFIKYKGSIKLTEIFIPDLENEINQTCQKNNLGDFFCILQFVLSTKNEVKNIECYSTNEIIKNNLITFLSENENFETLKPENIPIDCGLYIPILYQNGKIYIPEYTPTSGINTNYMNLIPEN